MNQIVFNVTVAVSEQIRDEWLEWMREVQIPRTLKTGLFLSARLLRVHAFERDALTYSIQYHAKSRVNFERYQREFAPDIDAKHQEMFGDEATCFSTILEILETFERPVH